MRWEGGEGSQQRRSPPATRVGGGGRDHIAPPPPRYGAAAPPSQVWPQAHTRPSPPAREAGISRCWCISPTPTPSTSRRRAATLARAPAQAASDDKDASDLQVITPCTTGDSVTSPSLTLPGAVLVQSTLKQYMISYPKLCDLCCDIMNLRHHKSLISLMAGL